MNRIILLSLAAATSAGLLFVNVYNSVVDAANWNAFLPESMATAREYFKVASPGTFFRVVSPIGQILALVTVIICWNYGRLRYLALAALVLAVGADALTFGYFYPRLDIMFTAPLANGENIRSAVEQWSSMNWVRSAMCATNTSLAFTTLILTVRKTAI
jgi:uncharacterized membrane protein